jgi:hypothetical protein
MSSASMSAGDRKSAPDGSHAAGDVAIVAEPFERFRAYGRGQRLVVNRTRVVEREGKRECAVRMHAVANRMTRARQELYEARGERFGERLQCVRPAGEGTRAAVARYR